MNAWHDIEGLTAGTFLPTTSIEVIPVIPKVQIGMGDSKLDKVVIGPKYLTIYTNNSLPVPHNLFIATAGQTPPEVRRFQGCVGKLGKGMPYRRKKRIPHVKVVSCSLKEAVLECTGEGGKTALFTTRNPAIAQACCTHIMSAIRSHNYKRSYMQDDTGWYAKRAELREAYAEITGQVVEEDQSYKDLSNALSSIWLYGSELSLATADLLRWDLLDENKPLPVISELLPFSTFRVTAIPLIGTTSDDIRARRTAIERHTDLVTADDLIEKLNNHEDVDMYHDTERNSPVCIACVEVTCIDMEKVATTIQTAENRAQGADEDDQEPENTN